jgi:DNA-binding transcriptional MerR regulator
MSAATDVRELRIGEMALVTGCSERALRYYEEIGLLRPAGHSAGGLRRYGEREIARVRRIRELQDLMGFDLDEIRTIVHSEDRLEEIRAAWHAGGESGHRPELAFEAIGILEDLRDKVDEKLARLKAFRGELDDRAAKARSLVAAQFGTPAGGPAKETGDPSR